ncbi:MULTISPECIES: SAM-dependent methyltransferase [Actinomadura]|uniref:SAM-dependent methyltransferase n=1 Tax=Actinomadura yumaensis TaxID=111807 RepID=A0ABW2CDF1_9ACTN|nr:SAM-dependent methyltransferase [Actinomadura sp. J1-007]MWK38081.1 methyltransferase domain-containing protein [Actinomadura sp. J1-007]
MNGLQPDTDAGPGCAPDLGPASPARVYDYLLGGKDNYAADRVLVDDLLRLQPHLVDAARENRAFVRRAVRDLAGLGIGQFLDIGCGLPTPRNVHQIAARHAPGARVAYVDNDPIVLAHARALLTHDGGVRVVQADLRKPDELLGLARDGLDLSAPVAVLLASVLHLLADAEDPHGAVAELRGALAPGSALVVSHLATGFSSAAAALYTERCTAPLVPRERHDIARFFGGLRLADPGLVPTTRWRPDGPARPDEHALMYAGVAFA